MDQKSNLSKKAVCVWLILLVFCCGVRCYEVIDTMVEPTSTPVEGSTIILKCRVSNWYEFCVWRHKDKVCEFEWKRSHDAVKKQTCTALDERATFVGSFDSFECDIRLTDVTEDDSGTWKCEMEAYVLGPIRGNTVYGQVEVRVVPKPVPTTTTTVTTTTVTTVTTATTATTVTTVTTVTTATTVSTTTVTDPEVVEATKSGQLAEDSDQIVFPDSSSDDDGDTVPNARNSEASTTSPEDTELYEDIFDERKVNDLAMDILGASGDGSAASAGQALAAGNQTVAVKPDWTEGPPILLIVLLTCSVVFFLVLLAVFLLYRHRRKYSVESEWKATEVHSDGENDVSKRNRSRLELTAFASDSGSSDNEQGHCKP